MPPDGREPAARKAPIVAARKPKGLMGFSGRPGNSQLSPSKPTVLPTMPMTMARNGLTKRRKGKMTVASSPASVPKPTQINTTLIHC